MPIDAGKYWEDRYSSGGNSGRGSYGELAVYKAEFLNAFISENNIQSVIEFGCGDGNQLRLARYPSYLGFDISHMAVALCRDVFKADRAKRFRPLSEYRNEQAELALSLDVIFHLVQDEEFARHMDLVFNSAKRHVIIYSSNTDDQVPNSGRHFRQRKFSDWIEREAPGWELLLHEPNRYPHSNEKPGSLSDFFVYKRS
jgi:hypothetical protein